MNKFINENKLIICLESINTSHIALGRLVGKFMWCRRVKKRGQELFKSKPSEYFTAQDLFVGAIVCLNSVNFLLLNADEFTLSYTEKYSEEVKKKPVKERLFSHTY